MRNLRLMAQRLQPPDAPQAAFCARKRMRHELEVHRRRGIVVVVVTYEALVTKDFNELMERAWEDVVRVAH